MQDSSPKSQRWVNTDMRTQIEDALRAAVFRVEEKHRLEGHLAGVKSVSFSPDGRVLATGSADDIIKLWDVTSGQEINTPTPLTGNSVSFRPDRRVLATGSSAGIIKILGCYFWTGNQHAHTAHRQERQF